MKKLTDDVAALKPSLFVAVPRVLERIQSGIVAKLKQKPWIVRFIFNLAFKLKRRSIKAGTPVEKVSLVQTFLIIRPLIFLVEFCILAREKGGFRAIQAGLLVHMNAKCLKHVKII